MPFENQSKPDSERISAIKTLPGLSSSDERQAEITCFFSKSLFSNLEEYFQRSGKIKQTIKTAIQP